MTSFVQGSPGDGLQALGQERRSNWQAGVGEPLGAHDAKGEDGPQRKDEATQVLKSQQVFDQEADDPRLGRRP